MELGTRFAVLTLECFSLDANIFICGNELLGYICFKHLHNALEMSTDLNS